MSEFDITEIAAEKKTKCPRCQAEDYHETAVRNRVIGGISIVDVGWHCVACGFEWGFERL
jgi:transposase-like protein